MTLFRVIHDKHNPYLTVNTTIASDQRISWKAKGIWFYAFSRPDNWQFFFADLKNQSSDGRDSLRAGLKELEKAGYLHRQPKRNDKGHMEGWDWFFFETSKTEEEIKLLLPKDGKPVTQETPLTEERPLLINEVKPTTERKESNDTSPEASEVNNLLYGFLREINPKFSIKSKDSWVKNAKKLLKQYSAEELTNILTWIFTCDHPSAEFWRGTIASPNSLYKNIDQIVVQMNTKTKKEVKLTEAQERTILANENKEWVKKRLSKIKFLDREKSIELQQNMIYLNNGGEHFPLGYAEKNFKEIVENKLRSWEMI